MLLNIALKKRDQILQFLTKTHVSPYLVISFKYHLFIKIELWDNVGKNFCLKMSKATVHAPLKVINTVNI